MSWFGASGESLAAALGLPRVEALERTGSTMDVAHELAALGAPAGTLVVAEAQERGRGRAGHAWRSERGRGLWLTLVERPHAREGVDVLSLRIGLRLAPVLERWTDGAVRLKWPNDLLVEGRKLAGILVEARWRGERLDWVAIGLGVNLVPPSDATELAGLGAAEAPAVLAELVPAIRAAAFASDRLDERELAAFAERDLAAGLDVVAPAVGTVRGITRDGALIVATPSGEVECRTGSLRFARQPTPPSSMEMPHAARR